MREFWIDWHENFFSFYRIHKCSRNADIVRCCTLQFSLLQSVVLPRDFRTMMILIVIVTLVFISPNDATSKSQKSFWAPKFETDRDQNDGVIDMDSLMDTHYPRLRMIQMANEEKLAPMKSKPQHKPKAPSRDFESVLLPETGTGDRVFGNLVQQAHGPSSSSTEHVETEIPGVSLEPNTIPPVLRKLFLDSSSNVSKRGYLSNLNILHKAKKSQKTKDNSSSSWVDQSISRNFGTNVLAPKIIPPLLQNLRDSKVAHFRPFWKRSSGTRMKSPRRQKIEAKSAKHLREPRNAQDEEIKKWEEWHLIQNPNVIEKRETSCRRMRISDIWSKPKKDNSSHEDSVKIVLPLLLSDKDVKEAKKQNIVLYANKRPGSGSLHVPVSGTTSTTSEGLQMKNFRIKGEDGKEYSFSASVSDVHQLLGLLSKPDSTLIMEKVPPEKGKQYLFDGGGRKVSVMPKPVGTSLHAGCTDTVTDVPDLKEIETDVLENVLQADIPCTNATTNGTTSATTTTGTSRHSNTETSSISATIVEFCDAD
ncbi:hypothetical protein GE061_013712 [Apolygus lucorum]|uniref:Uncharacterized protein n=1 Tax=Apolygus lucorum TaxID=248454 RepID=A0A8S9XRB1_APOLU|nr:hypothetical protein GE061_013712 [Apolygus lucorum]